jgi:hypothetical protein
MIMTVKEFNERLNNFITKAQIPEDATIRFYISCESCGHGGLRNLENLDYNESFNRLTLDIEES